MELTLPFGFTLPFMELTLPFVIAQVCGVIIIVICALAPHRKTKNGIILMHVIANAFCIVQFSLLGAMTGMAGSILVLIRGGAFIWLARVQNFSVKLLFLWVFGLAQLGIVYATWDGWHCALMLVPVLYTYGQWQDDIKITRITLFFTTLAIGTYCIMTGAFTGAVNEFIQSGSIILALWRVYRLDEKKGKVNKNELGR